MPDKPYSYVRFNWWHHVDLDRVAEDFKGSFDVEKIKMPSSDQEISLHKDERDELSIKADTLTARLSSTHALLSQAKKAPFTARDLELRRRVLDLYTRDRPTPFPWEFSIEPKYELVQK